MRKFHSLPPDEQDVIRRDYKNKYNREYRYSIHLFILYVFFGILSIFGLFLFFYYDVMLGSILFTLGIIFLFIDFYFLNKSNEAFYRYLKKRGYLYK